MQTKKFLSVLLTLLMMAGVIAVAPVTASAATVLEVSTASELATALAAGGEGYPIKLSNKPRSITQRYCVIIFRQRQCGNFI